MSGLPGTLALQGGEDVRKLRITPAEAIARMAKAVNPVPNMAPSWNIAPSQ